MLRSESLRIWWWKILEFLWCRSVSLSLPNDVINMLTFPSKLFINLLARVRLKSFWFHTEVVFEKVITHLIQNRSRRAIESRKICSMSMLVWESLIKFSAEKQKQKIVWKAFVIWICKRTKKIPSFTSLSYIGWAMIRTEQSRLDCC